MLANFLTNRLEVREGQTCPTWQPWTEEELLIPPSDPRYYDIPIVSDSHNRIILRVGDVITPPANLADLRATADEGVKRVHHASSGPAKASAKSLEKERVQSNVVVGQSKKLHAPPPPPPAAGPSSIQDTSISTATAKKVKKNKQYQSSSDHPILVAMEEERRLANRGELGRNQHTKMLITTSKDRTEALYVPHTAAPSRRPKKSNQWTFIGPRHLTWSGSAPSCRESRAFYGPSTIAWSKQGYGFRLQNLVDALKSLGELSTLEAKSPVPISLCCREEPPAGMKSCCPSVRYLDAPETKDRSAIPLPGRGRPIERNFVKTISIRILR
ncbi:hypothetical protein CVT26_006646 [Gymnopilus dilepis]|uniref:Uncharacterized protein n=1 Tax=Gymnopilus dilepis TaxID=231916 RepID=A0A409Y2W8_9AGAR|nr:hypothetical protein CVT26_006646 [Gymnopilus dilepis]